MKQLKKSTITQIKHLMLVLCFLPFVRLLYGAFTHSLGPDPVMEIIHSTGVWSLRLLMLTLAFTPLRKWTGWHWTGGLRRMVALYAFFYGSLHLLAYLVFEQFFDWAEILKDVIKRPYITAGFVSFVLMVPLAVTSTNAMIKRMGGRNWQWLHRLTYPLAGAAVLHYFWLVKQDITRPAIYALILCALLCARMVKPHRKPISFEGLHKAG
jgi:sulfoxide reductase heme-binding subunit YedZ